MTLSAWMMRKTKSLLCSRLQLPESMTFEEYVKFVNIESNVRTDEQLTETAVNRDNRAELQTIWKRSPEEEAEEANTIEPNVYSLAYDSYYSVFFSK